jgi:transposase
MEKFKPINDSQLFLLPPSVEDFVPQGHLARVIDEVVEALDTTSIEQRYSDIGQKSYHPKIILKLLIYGYSTGTVSGRKIAAKCESDTAYMYLASMYRPDFRTINDFRKDNLSFFKKCFVDVIKICQQLKMVNVGTIAIDGTKIRANASVKRTKDREGYQKWLDRVEQQIQDIITRAEQVNAREDQQHGDVRGDELPKELQQKEKLKSKIQQALNQLKDDEEKINLTDGDAKMIKNKGRITTNYNCQGAVTEQGIIVSAYATNAASDKEQLQPIIAQAEQNTGEAITTILADSGYASYDNYEALELQRKTAYMPDQEYDQQSKRKQDPYDRSNFTYDAEQDKYICPQGNELAFTRLDSHKKNKQKSRVYTTTACMDCPVKNLCTKGKQRQIHREFREHLREKARELLNSPPGQAQYLKRMYTIEPVWANIKHNKGIKMFSLRGIEKVNAEFLLHCLCHNISKIHQSMQRKKAAA